MSSENLKLDYDEAVRKVVRKHWFIPFTQLFFFAIAAIAPIFIAGAVNLSDILAELRIAQGALTMPVTFFLAAWFLVMWMMAFTAWTDYYLDVWTITNKRIIAVDQRGLFNRSISSFRLERLQDLNIHINGIIATALNFGTLEAETASRDDSFIIHGVPRPRDIKALIQGCADQLIAVDRRDATGGVAPQTPGEPKQPASEA